MSAECEVQHRATHQIQAGIQGYAARQEVGDLHIENALATFDDVDGEKELDVDRDLSKEMLLHAQEVAEQESSSMTLQGAVRGFCSRQQVRQTKAGMAVPAAFALDICTVGMSQIEEIPPSTLGEDLEKMWGDAMLPDGKIAFVVGQEKERIENVAKNILCVRSEVFSDIFRNQSEITEMVIPNRTAAAFKAFIRYLLRDVLMATAQAQLVVDVMMLAAEYQVPRLHALCMQSLEKNLVAENATSLIEVAHDRDNEWLLQRCRKYILDNCEAVVQAEGVEQLYDLGVTKGLLRDALCRLSRMPQGGGSS